MRTLLVTVALLAAGAGCNDDKGSDDTNTPVAVPTFTEDYVESGVIEALNLRHGAVEFEDDYDGRYPITHPIVLELRYASDAVGYTHPLYWGVVNPAHTRACVLGSEQVSYGGPDVDPEDETARSFVMTGAITDACAEILASTGPYEIWVGANRLVRDNEGVDAEGDLVVGVNDLAMLESGNVQIFDADGTDLSGLDRNASCTLLDYDETTGSWEAVDGSEGCATSVEIEASKGPNILLHDLHPSSSLGLIETWTDDDGTTTCVQQKGRPLYRVTTQVGLYGGNPTEGADGLDENALVDPLTMRYRLCLDDDVSHPSCDESGAWIELVANPLGDNPREAGDADLIAEIESSFADEGFETEALTDIPNEATDGEGLEAGGTENLVTDIAWLEQEPVVADLYLPASACTDELLSAASAAVLEVCALAPDDTLDQAYGKTEDNCRTVAVDLSSTEATAAPPSDISIGDWEFDVSLGNSDFSVYMEGELDLAYNDTPMGYGTFDFATGIEGKWDLVLHGVSSEAEANASTGVVYVSHTVTYAGVDLTSYYDEDNSSIEYGLTSASYDDEGCIDQSVNLSVVEIDVEACSTSGLVPTATLAVGTSSRVPSPYAKKILVGMVDVGVAVIAQATFDGSVGSKWASVSITAGTDPLIDIYANNDAYLTLLYTTTGSAKLPDDYKLVLDVAALDVGYDACDVYLKVKGCLAGACDSKTVVNYDGWEDSYTVYDNTWSTTGSF